MNEFIIEEGNLIFDFSLCGKPVKFDVHNNSGLYAVDFFVTEGSFVDREGRLLFIEVKDYQNPNTPRSHQKDDYKMLLNAGISKESIFSLKMGMKIKDSLLSLYAKGSFDLFTKNVLYLLFINCNALMSAEKLLLLDKIYRLIPTGLNNNRFTAFKQINFKLVDAKVLKAYGIICTEKRPILEETDS